MKKILYAALLAASLFQAQTAMAECRKINLDTDTTEWVDQNLSAGPLVPYSERQVSFGQAIIDVDPGLAVGETIVTGMTPTEAGSYIVACEDMAGTIRYDLASGDAGEPSGVYPTGIQGVGYRFIYTRASGSQVVFPSINPYTQVGGRTPAFISLVAGASFSVDLVKTGDMLSQSTVALGPVAKIVAGGDGQTTVLFNADPVTLRVLPHCWVASDSAMFVDFGPFGPKDVSPLRGPTKPVTISVACDGPTAPNTISASLTATPDTDQPSYIKNSGATNLAIRLRDIGSQNVLRPQDSTSTLTQTSPGFNATFNLEATVLRVNSLTPMPGLIDAQAVVTLSFL
ncbi:fimbrial protein [Achromobacter seleniivolatilans]|uniref:Fimbrial protein n=1 Tax=Achromobacter seleniivolatilans TaxID=3047478 RepID=A0ABY9LZX5_9BURK|nr:fimbrial protein [Achromobacter sp. R39]WMD20255.1 fimbrial protein [Achromobacter sp. R39]